MLNQLQPHLNNILLVFITSCCFSTEELEILTQMENDFQPQNQAANIKSSAEIKTHWLGINHVRVHHYDVKK